MKTSDRQAIPYRRRTIIAATMNGQASAMVYPERKRFDGAALSDAIRQAKAWIDIDWSVRHTTRRAPHIASALEYAEALGAVNVNEWEVLMLKAHAAAPERQLTATEIARAAGYADYSAANMHYGKLARRVAEHLELTVPAREDGTPVWTCALAAEGTPNLEAGAPEFVWRMHEEVAAALEQMNWKGKQ